MRARILPLRSRTQLFTLALAIGPGVSHVGDARAAEAKHEAPPAWVGEELPLPLSVRTPADLVLKQAAERQYLIFNLMAGGKLAWDRGDFATAARKWEALLALAGLDPELDRAVRPFAIEARARAGGQATSPPLPLPPAPAPPGKVAVSGTVTGGGAQGPGGAVVWLKRADGHTPRPAPSRGKVMHQVQKTFVPRVLPVTVGSKVAFHNRDAIFHNVFSLSRPNDFDAGLYKSGDSYERTFSAPGPVQILCNIHSSMIGYVMVLDTPYFAQAAASGAFTIKGVPPGVYVLAAWHESSPTMLRDKVTVGPAGVRGLALKMEGVHRAPAYVPDKYGKPRQAQLGY